MRSAYAKRHGESVSQTIRRKPANGIEPVFDLDQPGPRAFLQDQRAQ